MPWDAASLSEVYVRMARSGAGFIVIGGQAVNLWAEHYQQKEAFPPEVWTKWLPWASRDLDCLGGSIDAETVGRDFGVTPLVYPALGKAWTPAAADVRVPLDGRELLVQFLHSAKGLKTSEVEREARILAWGGATIRVLHPAHCLEGKLANLCHLNQVNPPRQDLKHARLSVLIFNAFIRERLALGKAREALELTERVMRLSKGPNGLKAWHEHGLEVQEAIPLDDLRDAAIRETQIRRFLELRWQQLQTISEDRRQRFAVRLRAQGKEPHPVTLSLPTR